MKETIEVPVTWLRGLRTYVHPCPVMQEGKYCHGCMMSRQAVYERITALLNGNKVELDD